MESRNILDFRGKGASGTVRGNLTKRQRLKETEGVLFKGRKSGGARHRIERRQDRRAEGARQGPRLPASQPGARAEEHTSELQSQSNLVCRLLLEKKKRKQQ